MKKLFMIAVALVVWMTSCDQYKENYSPVVEYTVKYYPGESRLVNLGALVVPGKGSAFQIVGTPSSGGAEILKSAYLRYDPNGNFSDRIAIDAIDPVSGKKLKANIFLQPTETDCGIAIFDHATIKSGTPLVFNLASNDILCEPMSEGAIEVIPLENADGIGISVPRPGDPDYVQGDIKIRLTYSAPSGFTGMVRAMYNAGMNLKDEYKDKWTSGEDLLQHPEYFKYYVTSLVEIEVTN